MKNKKMGAVCRAFECNRMTARCGCSTKRRIRYCRVETGCKKYYHCYFCIHKHTCIDSEEL